MLPLAHQHDVIGVTGSNLRVLGKVHFTIQLKDKLGSFSTEFYVTTNFALPVDVLLGLETMKKLQMVINPNSNVITYQEQYRGSMDEPIIMPPSIPQRSAHL